MSFPHDEPISYIPNTKSSLWSYELCRPFFKGFFSSSPHLRLTPTLYYTTRSIILYHEIDVFPEKRFFFQHRINLRWEKGLFFVEKCGSNTTQCGNFGNFLARRFYVKSISGIFRGLKTAILTYLEPLSFDFLWLSAFAKDWNFPKSKNQNP